MKIVFVLVLAVSFALGAGAQCYPPGSRVVVFLQGVYTALDEDGTIDVGWEDHAFDKIKAAYIAAGYNEAQLVDFSYNGGTVSETGEWIPNPYGCTDTDRPSAQNLAPLETMLRDYRAKHPQAHFTLIGHSLGGYLAFLEAERESRRSESDRLGIDTVITLAAPLKGVSADKKIALDVAVPCDKTYAAAAEIVADKERPDIAALRAGQVEAMRAAGIRLATLGNNGDCLYNLPRCTQGIFSIIDDSPTQYIENADLVKRYEIQSASVFLSHFAIFVYPQALIDLIAFAGAP